MVRWNPTEMVVVEMTSKNPSYRLTEGGIFSLSEPTIYDKPFKSYEEMIGIMESRNIIIQDKYFALSALQNFSYYGLVNGYKNTFLQEPHSDMFQKGTRFEELYTLHIIDTSLNSILFKYILYLEKALKSRISYCISQKYGVYTDKDDRSCMNPNDYLYKKNYSNSSKRRINILLRLKECIAHTRNNPIIIHYLNDRNHIPPWILTTNISYGLAIEWYSILKNEDKMNICNSFISPGILSEEETKEFIKKVIDLTKEYRNKIAHGNRTFSILNLPQLPKKQLLTLTYNLLSDEEYNSQIGQNDTLAVLLGVFSTIHDPYIANNLINELEMLLHPYVDTKFNKHTIFELLGFPSDIFERLKTLLKRLYT